MRVTQILGIDPAFPHPETIEIAATVLRDGKLVAFPTETVYGLGANARSEAAVRGIFEAKGRPSNNPLIVHVAQIADAIALTAQWPEMATKLATAFWPGPLTLVLPSNRSVSDMVTAGGTTVAIRMPAHPVARALLQATRLPIAAPSANRSGQLSPTRAEHVIRDLQGRIDLILDAGPTPEGIESTVVDLSSDRPRLLRPGSLVAGTIEAIIGPLERVGVEERPSELKSPGMLSQHYAPRTPLYLVSKEMRELTSNLPEKIGVVWIGRFDWPHDSRKIEVVELSEDPIDYARRLYDELHRLDQMNLKMILVLHPPEREEWLAIRDRLSRASHRDAGIEAKSQILLKNTDL